MTIPNLMANNAKTEQVVALKSVYSDISQALKLMMADEGVSKVTDTNILTTDWVEDWTVGRQRAGEQFLKKYFKYVKYCPYDESPNTCFAESYKSIDGNTTSAPLIHEAAIVTSSGSSISVQPASPVNGGVFMVDINGLKGPNIAGRDLFSIGFYYDGSLDAGISPNCRKGVVSPNNGVLCEGHNDAQESRQAKFENNCASQLSGIYGHGCFGKILNDGWKMDY